jgi:hypothetical protein
MRKLREAALVGVLVLLTVEVAQAQPTTASRARPESRVGVAQTQPIPGLRPRFESVAPNLSKLVKESNFRSDAPVSVIYTKENAPAVP